jgi:predicted amidohydrolase
MKTRIFIAIAIALLLGQPAYAQDDPAKTSIKVAAVQLQAADVGNFAKMQSLAAAAKQQGAQLVIFPEGSVFGWLNPAVFTEAEPIPGKYSDQFAAIAKSEGLWVAAGLAERGPKAGGGALPNAYQAYDSGILINPQGELVLHHRKYNILKNAFNPDDCKKILGQDQCSYIPGPLSDITTIPTPFGKTSLLVCADAYIPSQYNPGEALKTLKTLAPKFVIVPWGITAGTQTECGSPGFNATGFTAQAAGFLKSAFVVGSNGVGPGFTASTCRPSIAAPAAMRIRPATAWRPPSRPPNWRCSPSAAPSSPRPARSGTTPWMPPRNAPRPVRPTRRPGTVSGGRRSGERCRSANANSRQGSPVRFDPGGGPGVPWNHEKHDRLPQGGMR